MLTDIFFYYLFNFFSKPDSSTSSDAIPSKKENETANKDIINYPNDSLLSITSVQGTNPQLQQTTSTNLLQVSQIPLSSASSGVSNKISLVPTKLLLKTQSGFVPTSSSSITTNAQSSIPMKVVFVNAISNHVNAQQAGSNQQQITLNKTLAQQLQSPSKPTFFTANKLLGHTQTTKVQLVNQMPSPNYTTATISNLSTNNIAKVSAATSSNGHRHDSSTSSSSVNRKSKSSKSLLGSNKLPGKFYNLLISLTQVLIFSYKKSVNQHC